MSTLTNTNILIMELDSMDVDFTLNLVEELEDRADTSSSIYIDNNEKDILILGKGPKQVLGQHSLAAEKIRSVLQKKHKILSESAL